MPPPLQALRAAPAELMKLYDQLVRRYRPAEDLSSEANVEALRVMLNKTRGLDSPTAMQTAALRTALAAPKLLDEEMRLTTIPDARGAAGATMQFHPGFYAPDRLYVDQLGSKIPMGGLYLMRDLRRRYPHMSLELESLPNEKTLQFYDSLGMRNEPNPYGGSLPYFILRPDEKLLNKYGLPPLKRGGLVALKRTATCPC